MDSSRSCAQRKCLTPAAWLPLDHPRPSTCPGLPGCKPRTATPEARARRTSRLLPETLPRGHRGTSCRRLLEHRAQNRTPSSRAQLESRRGSSRYCAPRRELKVRRLPGRRLPGRGRHTTSRGPDRRSVATHRAEFEVFPRPRPEADLRIARGRRRETVGQGAFGAFRGN